MAGKPPTAFRTERIYQTDKPYRKLVFIEFDNYTDKKENDYLKKTIPRTIYGILKDNKRIQILKEDVIPQGDSLSKLISNHYVYTISNGMTNVSSTNRPHLPLYFTGTNFITNNEFHVWYLYGASNTKYINARFDNKFFKDQFSILNATNEKFLREYQFFTTNLIQSNEILLTNYKTVFSVKEISTTNEKVMTNFVTNISTNTNIGVVVSVTTNIQTNDEIKISYQTNFSTNVELSLLLETNDYYREFVMENTLISIKTNTLPNILSHVNKKGADFAVYGQLHEAGRKKIELRLFFIKTKKREFKLIYKRLVSPENLYQEMAVLPGIILGIIQERKIVNNILFDSNLKNTYVYINELYVGKTPLTIFSFPQGKYSFNLWNAKGEFDVKKNQEKESFIVDNFSLNNKYGTNTIIIDSNLDFSSNYFHFKERTDTGKIKITTDKGSNTVLHVNSILEEKFDSNASLTLPIGQHFLILSNENFQLSKMLVPIKKDTITEVNIRMRPISKPSKWDHSLGTKIFATVGATLGLATVINYLVYGDSLIKRDTIRYSGQINSPAYNYFNQKQANEVVSLYTLGGLALGNIIFAFISRILDIKSNVSKIYWEGEPNRYFKIKFVKQIN